MDTPDSQAPDNLLDAELDIVFYDPDRPYADKSLSSRSKSSAPTAIPKWKQLVERITSNKLLMDRQFERIEAQALLQDFSCAPFSEKPIKTAERLARDIITKDNRPARELILVSLCAVLATSSRASPEEIDQVLRVIVNSFEPRYLDRLKRGAAFANKIISALALRLEPSGHETLQLDRATQIILQGIHSLNEGRITPKLLTCSSQTYSFSMEHSCCARESSQGIHLIMHFASYASGDNL